MNKPTTFMNSYEYYLNKLCYNIYKCTILYTYELKKIY